MHSKFFEIAKKNYEKGTWDKEMLSYLVSIGKLTMYEYEEITESNI